MYIPVKFKYLLAIIIAILWAIFSTVLAWPWVVDLAGMFGWITSLLVIAGIAIIPGFMSAFLVASILLDQRPSHKAHKTQSCPPITVLIAAYNESASILSTLESIDRQHYPGELKVIVINDGSSDNTADLVRSKLADYAWLELLDLKKNVGKAAALNQGLELVTTPYTLTIDGDSYLYKNALVNLVYRYLSDPDHTRAVAGAVLVRNSRKNFVTKMQEWDYFHGIAAIKRLQSLYQGTLVAQGAFSMYDTGVLREVGGWPHCVGEDIVLTWAILKLGYRVGFAENACLFTNAPEELGQFIRQRLRWSRGLIEAFKSHWQLLFKARMTTLFIWWNLLFPFMDMVFTLAFIPGIILALFGIYWIAGPMTLILMPMALLVNYVMYRVQVRMFTEQELRVRKNIFGFIAYAFFYSFILQPACLYGYVKEMVNGSIKNWGTK